MIKRIVILQDETLVVREMTRVGRPQPAYAVAGGAGRRLGRGAAVLAGAADGAADRRTRPSTTNSRPTRCRRRRPRAPSSPTSRNRRR